MRNALLPVLLAAPLLAVSVAYPATAETGALGSGSSQGNSCESSDPSDVVVDSAANTAAVTGDLETAGNYFGCYTNILVKAGDMITFSHDTTCGGGAPRVYVSFKDGSGANTHDTAGVVNPGCVAATGSTLGTVTYTFTKAGKVRSFAFISDRDESTITYSNLVISGNVINF